jgi:hypothetical protein
MTEIEKRRAAVIATEQRFRNRPFDWRKAATCIHLVRFHAAGLGHKPPIVPKFRSALSAKKALLTTGFQTLPALLDSRFERIPPAFMRVGDVLAMPGDEDWHALVIKADKAKFLGWHQDEAGCTMMEVNVTAAAGAWRL